MSVLLPLVVALSVITGDAMAQSVENTEQGLPQDAPNQPRPWEMEPFFRPQAGLSSWASASGNRRTALNVGAIAGSYFYQDRPNLPIIMGLGRVQASWLAFGGADISGSDVRVGVFAGPAWDRIRLRTGPDIYRDVYQWGLTTLAPTVGLSWPLSVSTGLGPIGLDAGIEPAFFLASDRPSVDWSQQDGFGFGDEFSYFIAGAIRGDGVNLGLSYSQTTTAFGVARGVGVNASLGR
ncbi:MAG: hypothetical protein AAFV53_04415 [Myxococcota bacterium]